MQPDGPQAAGQIRELDVLTEEELIEPLQGWLELVRGHVEQDHVARLEHVQVGEHAPLRRQPRGVAAGSGGQRLDVVGQQALQVRCAVLAGDGNLCAQRQGAP